MTEIDLEALATDTHGFTVDYDEKDEEVVGEPDPSIVGRALED